MNKALKIVLMAFAILALIVISWITFTFYFYTRVQPYIPDPVYTADRSRVIIPSVNYDKEDYEDYLQVYLVVQDTKTGETIFQVQTNASDRMNWSVRWIGNSTLVLNSSDIGKYCWAEGNEGMWVDTECPQ